MIAVGVVAVSISLCYDGVMMRAAVLHCTLLFEFGHVDLQLCHKSRGLGSITPSSISSSNDFSRHSAITCDLHAFRL